MLENINTLLGGIAVPLLLCLAGIFFSVKLGFFHLRHPLTVIQALRSDGGDGRSGTRALTLALAGTLGVGNIVGVASAIALGGFGSVFWMWVSALFAMILKYAEIVLAMTHKSKNGNASSAMLYIKAFFSRVLGNKIGTLISVLFCISFLTCTFTMGSMLQANAMTQALNAAFGTPILPSSVIICVLTLFVILGGTSKIVDITNFLVPLMSAGFMLISLAVIVINYRNVPEAFGLIFRGALSPGAVGGGVGAFVFTKAMRYGVMRGLVSNEAGCGTAPTAHSIAQTEYAAKQGMFGIFEVFFDTVVLCTVTALVIILEYDTASGVSQDFMHMTVRAYSASLGKFASAFIAVAVLLFGFATVVCWAHYGTVCTEFLFGGKKLSRTFAAVYSLSVLIGGALTSELAWQLSDLSMSIMTVINLTALIGTSGEIKRQTELYFSSLK